MKSLGERIRHLRKLRGMSQQQLAARITALGARVSQPAIDQAEKTTRRPRYLPELAAALGTSTEWLLYEKGPRDLPSENHEPAEELPPSRATTGMAEPESVGYLTDRTIEIEGDTYAAIPRFDMRASAGGGAVVPNIPEIKNRALFRLEWIRRVTRSPLKHLAIIEVEGDSMEPTLRPGDNILIDTLQKHPQRRDGIYAINRDGELQVKRVAAHPVTRLLTITSDNPNYPSWQDIPPDQIDIVGRVIWGARAF